MYFCLIFCGKKDIRTIGQVLFQEQKGTCAYVLLSNNLRKKRHKNKRTELLPRTKGCLCAYVLMFFCRIIRGIGELSLENLQTCLGKCNFAAQTRHEKCNILEKTRAEKCHSFCRALTFKHLKLFGQMYKRKIENILTQWKLSPHRKPPQAMPSRFKQY